MERYDWATAEFPDTKILAQGLAEISSQGYEIFAVYGATSLSQVAVVPTSVHVVIVRRPAAEKPPLVTP